MGRTSSDSSTRSLRRPSQHSIRCVDNQQRPSAMAQHSPDSLAEEGITQKVGELQENHALQYRIQDIRQVPTESPGRYDSTHPSLTGGLPTTSQCRRPYLHGKKNYGGAGLQSTRWPFHLRPYQTELLPLKEGRTRNNDDSEHSRGSLRPSNHKGCQSRTKKY